MKKKYGLVYATGYWITVRSFTAREIYTYVNTNAYRAFNHHLILCRIILYLYCVKIIRNKTSPIRNNEWDNGRFVAGIYKLATMLT